MNEKSMLTVGFLSLMAATAVGIASDSFAADARRMDVIETLNETVAQLDSMKAEGESMRVDVISRIGSEGPVYPYARPMNR
jgi:hypothetical protein